jgi:AhpD family alkylhydroperoxidase
MKFVDLENDVLEDVGGVDLVFDVLGDDIAKRSAGVIRAGGTLVTITGPTEARPADGLTVDFVVVFDRAQLSEIVRRARDGRLRTNIGKVSTLDDGVAAFNRTERIKGKTIIRVHPDCLTPTKVQFTRQSRVSMSSTITPTVFNGCAFCIDMHSKDARVNGETEQRLYALSAWRETLQRRWE